MMIATSVVVPPISATAKSLRPVRKAAPTTLAAGPGKHRLDRILEGDTRPHQRSVTLHDHQRGSDRLALERLAHRLEQMPDVRHQAGIERGSQRPLGRVQLRAQLVAAGDRLAAQGSNALAHPQLVLGVAHRELRRDGKCLHPRSDVRYRRLDRRLIERLLFHAGRVMSATHAHDHASQLLLDARLGGHAVIEAHEDRRRSD